MQSRGHLSDVFHPTPPISFYPLPNQEHKLTALAVTKPAHHTAKNFCSAQAGNRLFPACVCLLAVLPRSCCSGAAVCAGSAPENTCSGALEVCPPVRYSCPCAVSSPTAGCSDHGPGCTAPAALSEVSPGVTHRFDWSRVLATPS